MPAGSGPGDSRGIERVAAQIWRGAERTARLLRLPVQRTNSGATRFLAEGEHMRGPYGIVGVVVVVILVLLLLWFLGVF